MKADKEFHDFLLIVGQNIKKYRERAKITQEEMADLVDYKYYQRIEYGQKNITLKTVLKIAKKLNVQPKDLFTLPKE